MINSLKMTLPQGLELSNACIEIQSYRYTVLEAKETQRGADRTSNGQLAEVEAVEMGDAEPTISSVEYQYAVWANQAFKNQNKPHFEMQVVTLDFSKHPELREMLNNFAETATDMQRFERVGDTFLNKVLA